MKHKKILFAFVVLIAIFVSSSCEDMLRVESKTVVYDDENTLDHPTDTVYSVLGILKGMQKIADRAVILGEIRGDLVETSDHANKDLAELYDYNLQNLKSSNRYNNPTDYYSIINNCNFFLANADTTLVKDRVNVFTREYIAVLCYRAWTYLQLAQIYGKVYYVDKPILSADMAQSLKGEPKDIREIADALLYEFEKYKERYVKAGTPNYKDLAAKTGSGETSTTHTSTDLFIPVLLIMGDLALWAEHYDRAALYYHEYLTREAKPIRTGTNKVLWFSYDFMYLDPNEKSYASSLGANAEPICYIPMEADIYNGVVSDLPNIFNSNKDNDYYYQLTSSRALVGISTRQNYCYHYIDLQDNINLNNVLPFYAKDKLEIDAELLRGDLRLQSILTQKTRTVDEFSSKNLSTSEQTLIKINAEKICLYRNDVVYLRLAEALNRAGMPQMAFNILKTGLYSGRNGVIDSTSIKKAAQLNMPGVLDFNNNFFQGVNYIVEDLKESTSSASRTIEDGGELATIQKYNTIISGGNTMGIHSRGCGDASIDTLYQIDKKLAQMALDGTLTGNPLTDSIRAVEEFLIDEMALETCFEGYRFGDLMRIAMHRAADNGDGFAENDFLAKRVASRRGATMDSPWIEDAKDVGLHDLLKGDGKSYNENWFLKLPHD